MKRRHFIAGTLFAPAIIRRGSASYNIPAVSNIVRQQVIANGGVIPVTSQAVPTTSLWESRVQVKNGAFDASDIRVVLYLGYIDASGGGELALPNAQSVQAAIESITLASAKFSPLSAQPIVLEPPGVAYVVTDPVGFNLIANEVFRVQLATQVTAGDSVSLSRFNAASVGTNGWNSYRSALIQSQIGVAGVWSGVNRLAGIGSPGPTAIIGTPVQNYPSVAMLGDSNLVGRDDFVPDAFGNFGHIAKALYTSGPGGASVPVMNLAQSGENLATWITGKASVRNSLLKYVSHVVTNYGRNDIHGGQTPATVQGWLTTLWATLRARGLRVIEQTFPPWTTSTDGWTTVENQSYVVNFQPGGPRDQMNAFKLNAFASGLIDGIIDINAVLADSGDSSKWAVGTGGVALTADGQHANSAGHTACVPVARTALSSLMLPLTPIHIPV